MVDTARVGGGDGTTRGANTHYFDVISVLDNLCANFFFSLTTTIWCCVILYILLYVQMRDNASYD